MHGAGPRGQAGRTEPGFSPLLAAPPATADELLRAIADVEGDRDAYVEAGGARLTFTEWDRAAEGTAGALAELGAAEGSVVSLLLPSSVDYAVCYLAAMRLGAVTSGVNPRLGPDEVASILARTSPAVLVHPDEVEPPAGSWRAVPRHALAGMRRHPPARRLAAADPGRPVAVVWTSGTTGEPKGAVFDHRNLTAVSLGAGPLRAPFDRRISAIPFSHVGYMAHVAEDIGHAMTTVVPSTPWKAGEVLALMAAERVTVGQGVPSQWRLLLDHPDLERTDLSTLRICGTGAAPVPPSLVREMRDRFGCPVVIGYTSTEAALTTGSLPDDPPELIARTVGRARDNVELRVVDDGGRPLPPGTLGEVQCRSAAVMRGYWGDPERTAAVLGVDGWLDTGDTGSLDADGYLTLFGRRVEMYLRGAYNVYPVEVERVLAGHPSVAQVAVVGKPDPVLGQIGVAFVVPADEPPELDELRRRCRQAIADYKAPDLLVLVDHLPLTAVGKVDKADLSKRAVALPPPSRGGPGPGSPPGRDPAGPHAM
ncbi:MAG: class I adenylate-forming enzyme family protein [Acidimicrobiales bacterium]